VATCHRDCTVLPPLALPLLLFGRYHSATYLRSNPLIPFFHCPTLAGIFVKFSHLSSKPTKLLRSKSFDMSATDRYIQTKITLLRNVFPLCSVQSRLVPQVWIELGGRSSIIRVIIAITYHSPCPHTHTCHIQSSGILGFSFSDSMQSEHEAYQILYVSCGMPQEVAALLAPLFFFKAHRG
jgi:hypothetical protein